MELFDKLKSIPTVERGFSKALSAYQRVKLNRLFWGVQHVESLVTAAATTIHPMLGLLNGPIGVVDRALCRSIDYVEKKVPAIALPPEMMLTSTKEYVSDRFVRPVLKRTQSVTKVSEYAALRFDGAINAADKYVERYLPADTGVDCVDGGAPSANPTRNAGNHAGANNALQKSRQLSRKITRRLTMRTMNEARALKKSGKEAVHIVRYAAILLVTDPLQACRQAIELWNYLSADEPENQAGPRNLEQLIVLVVREGARKVVHITNYLARRTAQIPRNMSQSSVAAAHYYVDTSTARIRNRVVQFEKYASAELERIAYYMAGRRMPDAGAVANPANEVVPENGASEHCVANGN